MGTEGVIKRDKFVGRGALQWLVGVPTILFLCMAIAGAVIGLAGTGAAVTAGLVMGCVSAPLALGMAFMWATLSVLRTVLTREALHVQCGLWGPRIRLDGIEECRVVDVGGVRVAGKRLVKGRWITTYIMAPGEQLEVLYQDEDGTKRGVRFSASDPQGLAAAIQRARGGVRIDTSGDASSNVDAEAFEEALAEAEASAEAEALTKAEESLDDSPG